MFQLTPFYVLCFTFFEFLQNIAKILKKDKGGKGIIKELKKGLLSYTSRCKMVRILVSFLIEKYTIK